MTGTPIPAASAAWCIDGRIGRSGYRVSYGANYRVGFCSQNGPAPASTGFSRIHRARLPAPHVQSLVGRVRVVGLEVWVVEVLAGAGPHGRSNTLGKGNRGMVKRQQRELHHQADGQTKAGEDGQGGWDRLLSRLAFGCVEVVL
jgi:hypothetical protein